jgi:2-amino-4-hydroxy-6-hydroxymethyldihydropteridine diphosphokinase
VAIYIALGANLGDRRANLAEALRRLEPEVHVEAVSALYESPPQPPAPPPAYLNAVCRVTTELAPRALLRHIKRIEREMGRKSARRWAPRPIDLDIVLYDDRIVGERDLIVPHPRLAERAFVLQPLLDLDPELRQPLTGERLADVLAQLQGYELSQAAPAGWHS